MYGTILVLQYFYMTYRTTGIYYIFLMLAPGNNIDSFPNNFTIGLQTSFSAVFFVASLGVCDGNTSDFFCGIHCSKLFCV